MLHHLRLSSHSLFTHRKLPPPKTHNKLINSTIRFKYHLSDTQKRDRGKLSLLLLLLLVTLSAKAEVPLQASDLSQPTKIAPAYFGPNALPVLDISEGRLYDRINIQIATDYYAGFKGDQTVDIFAKIAIPLFTERINLTAWMPIVEWYANTPQSLAAQRVTDTNATKGHEFGDVYITTDIQLMQQHKYHIDWVLRVGLKTASGGSFEKARYFDNPAYFFDMTFAHSFLFNHGFFKELRLVGNGGFLCWQTDNGRQNDAIMYGVMLKLKTRIFSLSETFGGYSGWERDGDLPMTLKTQLSFHIKDCEPFITYQYGLRDYPYHHIKLGINYRLPKIF